MADAVNELEDADAMGMFLLRLELPSVKGLSAVDKERVDTLLDKHRDVFASPCNTGCCTIA